LQKSKKRNFLPLRNLRGRPQARRNKGREAMAASTLPVPEVQLEDPLAHLPCSRILEYRKGQIIYSREELSTSLYLVIDGKVKVCRMPECGRQVVVDIYRTDEFFGETAFLDSRLRDERAAALEDNTKLMSWTTSEIEDIATRNPRLAIALLQIMAQRSIEFGHRIESFSADTISRRLARALVHFSEDMGQRNAEDGPVQMMSFTHELLAQYVGTSREIITVYMNQFRRKGYLDYSRKGILLHGDALKDWLTSC
jgi:CRP/FNR family transcriptional regulator, cyclic AMP receptor protein